MVNPTLRKSIRQPIEIHDRTVALQGLGLSAMAPALPLKGDQTPTLLKRTDPDFIAAILDELQRDAIFQLDSPLHRSRLIPSAITEASPFTLFQPVHRTFYVALLEAVCDAFNIPELQPRLSDRQIHSAGLVVRRAGANGIPEAWQTEIQPDGRRQKGWFPLTALTLDLDPDPVYHKVFQSTGQVELDRQLQATAITRQETVSALYVAPPDLCNHLNRTVLYGVVPVTSNEVSEVPPVVANGAVSSAIKDLLPYYLRSGGERSEPNFGVVLTEKDAVKRNTKVQQFIDTLRQLKFHFQAFDNAALMTELNQLTVQLSNATKPLGTLLQEATTILVDRQPGQVNLPEQWPEIASDRSQRIFNLLQANLLNRLSEVSAQEGRFEDSDRTYQVRAFIRLYRPTPCPPQIIWSTPSPTFAIAPWYANSDIAPVKVALPDITDFQTLKNLKPSVAFSVPASLFNFLKKQAPDPTTILKDGPADNSNSDSSGLDIAWICSFNIPIITLCAYLVLNIFLSLFNLIFWWIFMIKICIPIPKFKPKSPP